MAQCVCVGASATARVFPLAERCVAPGFVSTVYLDFFPPLIPAHTPSQPPLHRPLSTMVFALATRSALRSAARPAASMAARPAVMPAAMTLGRRGYAEAVSDKLKLSFILPHAVSGKQWGRKDLSPV